MAHSNQTEMQIKIAGLLNDGKSDVALKRAVAAAKKYPANPIFPQMAGAALLVKGNHSAAAPYFLKSYKIKPDHAEFQDNLARSLIASGQISSAETLLNKHAASRQRSANYHHLWALLYLNGDRFQQAVDAANVALDLTNGHLGALLVRGKALSGLQKAESALQDFDTVLAGNPTDIDAAEGRGWELASLGRLDEAKKQYFDLVAIDPIHLRSLEMMSGMPGLTEQDLINLEVCLDDAEAILAKNKGKRAPSLGFSRYEVAMRRGQTAEAMTQLSRFKAQLSRTHPFDDAKAERKCEALLAMPDIVNKSEPEEAMPRPIFVVGLPRSGTTLIEMTISAHAAVEGCGELPFIGRWVAENSQSTSTDELAMSYRASLPRLPNGIVAFVDKMPNNYQYLGYIAAAFPNSAIVNVERDPRDVALSMWRTNLGYGEVAYANDQRHMAAEANRYRRYMNHWTSKLGIGRIHSVCYEDLVSDIASQAPKIAAACGLDFDPAMLLPEKNSSAVRTSSRFQVRQTVHSRSIGAWEPFADELEVFINQLDHKLWAHYL